MATSASPKSPCHMADRALLPAVAGLLLMIGACAPAPEPSAAAPGSPIASPPMPLLLHWMSFAHHQEPRNQLLFEGGELGSFTALRLIGPDGTTMATANPVPAAEQVMRFCAGNPKTGAAPPVYGALRVTLNLASQHQMHDVIASPERYRVEVLAFGSWRQARLELICHAQE